MYYQMVNYQNGKIYKIVSAQTDKIYIGSSCEKYLSNRLGGHKTQYKHYQAGKSNYISSIEIVKFDDANIVLLESYPCKDKNELHARERYYIEQNKDILVNQYIPNRSKANTVLRFMRRIRMK